MAEIEWLLFLGQLPARPSSLRVNVWRRLRGAGAASLQNGVWILPKNEQSTIFMERLLAYIKEQEASGQIFTVGALNETVQEDIVSRFNSDRDQEYEEFLEQCAGFTAEIEKETGNKKFTFAELEENEQNLQRLRKWFARIQRRDFFVTPKAQEAMAAFQNCHQGLKAYTQEVYQREGIEFPADTNAFIEDDRPADEEIEDDVE